MDNNVAMVYAEPISIFEGKATAYAVTRVDSDGMPVDTANVSDCDMGHVVNECNVNGWTLEVKQ